MSTQENREVILVDSGRMIRLYGIFSVVASLAFSQGKMPGSGDPVFSLAGWGFVVVGLLMVVFASDLTVSVDRSTRILRLENLYLWFFRTTREIPFDEISDFRVVRGSHISGRSGATSTSYRLEAVLTNGKAVRFRWYSTGDGNSRKQEATRLRSALGLGDKSKADEGAGEKRVTSKKERGRSASSNE